MPNLKYHNLFCFILLILCPLLTKAQKVYEGQVINAITQGPLVNATVILLNGKDATATNQQGYFRLIVDQPKPNDTLLFTYVGFKTYRLATSAYQDNMFIKLEPATNQLEQVNVGAAKAKSAVIEKFNYADVRDTRGREYYPTFPYIITGIFAKQFEAPAAGTLLTTLHLGRRAAYDIPFDQNDFPKTTANKLTRFLLHIMTVDSTTGKPAKKLHTKEVTLSDNSLRITFDLAKERIVLPDKKFFVAVEWLLIPLNEIIQLEIGGKIQGVNKDNSPRIEDVSKYRIIYQPVLVIIPQWTGVSWRPRMSKVPIWTSRDGIRWSQTLNAHDIALSATVTY